MHGDATTDAAQVRALFARAPNGTLVGVACGPASGLDILDVDPRHGGEAWEQQNRLPETMIHATPSGGRHYVFCHHPGVRNRQGAPATGIDIRGEGGYAIWPPSAGYSVVHDAEPAEWPAWLLEQVIRTEPPPRPIGRSDPANISDARLDGLLRALLARLSRAPEGQKHEVLLGIARTLGGYAYLFDLADDQLVGLMLGALPDTVLDWRNAEKTARDGLAYGRAAPLTLEDRPNPNPRRTNGPPPQPGGPIPEPSDDPPPPPESELGDPLRGAILLPELHGCPLTEDGVAQAFAIEHGDDLRFCHGPNRWHVWDNTRWKPEQTKLAFHWVRTLARRMARSTASTKLRETMGKASFAGGVERHAQADRAFAVTAEFWDRDPWLLGTPGGTVDLRTGELREARREDFISRQTLVTPAEPGTPCPVWDKFLAEATNPHTDLIGFIHRWFGYSLTGITREEALVFLFGPGGNGKGVLMHAIFAVMGDYAVNAAIDAFTVTFADKHTTDIAMLNGARMVIATEVEEGRAWAEARIKSLTGRDPITARFMRQDNVTFVPIFKLAVSGNHKPRLRNVDDAAKRRINMVPFLNCPAVVDLQLAEKLVPEYPAILRRLIGGCIGWQTNGLMRPQVVVDATNEYFETENYFVRWLEECCTILPQLTERPGKLLASFLAWCKANGEPETDNKHLRGMLERVPGVKYVKPNSGPREFRGIALNPPATPDDRFG